MRWDDGIANQFRGPWLSCTQEDLRRRLRQHGLPIIHVTRLHLAAALKSEDDWVLRFSILGDGSVELR
jgi:hypothetical protein